MTAVIARVALVGLLLGTAAGLVPSLAGHGLAGVAVPLVPLLAGQLAAGVHALAGVFTGRWNPVASLLVATGPGLLALGFAVATGPLPLVPIVASTLTCWLSAVCAAARSHPESHL